MGDPLSVTASTLAVVNFAGQSCQFLFEFFRSVSKAPKEIQHHLAALEALGSTFANIEALGKDLPAHSGFSPAFHARLSDCMLDFQLMEEKFGKLNEQLDRNRMCRTWARLKWPSRDQDLRKFFSRVQTYHTTFSLDLLIHQVKSGIPNPEPVLSTNPVSPISETSTIPDTNATYEAWELAQHCSAARTCPPSVEQSSIPQRTSPTSPELVQGTEYQTVQQDMQRLISSASRLGKSSTMDPCSSNAHKADPLDCGDAGQSARFLASYVNPISIRISTSRHYETFCSRASLWMGPVMVQRWKRGQGPVYEVVRPAHGFGLSITLSSSFGKLRFTTYFTRKVRWPQNSLSVQCTLAFPAVVRKDAPIMQLAGLGNLKAMRKMFEAGKAAPTDATPSGQTLLHVAVKNGNVQMANLLLNEGADVNAPDANGETPLHVSVACTKVYDVTRLLIANGADLGNRNIDGGTPLHIFFNETVAAIFKYHGDMVDEEIQDAQGMTILHFLAWSSKTEPEIFERRLARGECNLWSKDDEGRSVLHYAAQRGNIALLDYFTGITRDANIGEKDFQGRTALHYAVASKRTTGIESIVDTRSDIREADHKGQTVLHHAAWRGNIGAVERIVALGGIEDLWSIDKSGKTPLLLASQRGFTAVVAYLTKLQSESAMSDGAYDQPLLSDCSKTHPDSVYLSRLQREQKLANTPVSLKTERNVEDKVLQPDWTALGFQSRFRHSSITEKLLLTAFVVAVQWFGLYTFLAMLSN